MVGANSVRPSKKQVHDYSHCRIEQKNYPITLVGDGVLDVPWLFARRIIRYPHTARLHNIAKNLNLTTPRNGLSRVPAPTIMHYFATPQNRSALCGFYVVQEDSKSGADNHSDTTFIKRNKFDILLPTLCTAYRLAPIEALPQTPTGLCPVPTRGFTP